MIRKKIFGKAFISLITLCLVFAGKAVAQTESYIQVLSGVIKPGAVCRIVDDKFINEKARSTVKKNIRVENLITFELRYDTLSGFSDKPFTCELLLDIDYKDSNNAESKIENVKLTLQFDTAKGKNYKAIAYYKFAGGHDVTATVKSITGKDVDVASAAFFRIKNQILIDRTYKKRQGNKDAAILQKTGSDHAQRSAAAASNLTGTMSNATNRVMEFTWDPMDFEYDKFDLEYTFYDANSFLSTVNFGTGSFDEALLEQAFKNNATRVSLNNPSYKINLVYPKGFLLVRVRAYTYNEAGGEMDREEGDWHYADGSGTNGFAVYMVTEHQEDAGFLLNWQYSASFAEEGKRKEVVSYFDGGNKSRQSVTISNSDQVSIVAETVLDNQNRPAVSILPAPSDEEGDLATFHFFPAFNKNTTGNIYSYQDFHPGNDCVSNAQPMNTDFGSSRYYSANNLHAGESISRDIPDAGGFPFAVTEYTNDQTGRIRRQGGVGSTFQLGQGHETGYYYGKPSQPELDRLFGYEAGAAAHYSKNMVVDANGQVSVSYADIAGKTVATALAGAVPANLKALPSHANAETTITDELVRPQSIVRDAANLKLSFNTTVLVPAAAAYNFKYEFSGRSLELLFGWNPEKKVCADCYYDVKFSISDECGAPIDLVFNGNTYQELLVPAAFNYGNNQPQPNTACGIVLPAQLGNISAAFPKTGEYKVSYELSMSKKALDFYMDYIKQAAVTKTITDYKKEYLKKVDLSGCFSDCRDCKEKLGTQDEFIERFKRILVEVDNITLTTDDIEWVKLLYNEALRKCGESVAKNCTVTDGCAEYRKMMLKDVTPGGQYMLYDENTLLFKERNINAFLKAKADHAAYLVQITRGGVEETVALSSLEESEIISSWNPEWAYLLLDYHPEKCLLDECKSQSESKNRDKEMLQTDDDLQAAVKFGWNPNNYSTFLNNERQLIALPYNQALLANDIAAKVNVFLVSRVKSNGVFYPANANSNAFTPICNISLMQYIKYMVYCENKPKENANHQLEYIDLDCIPAAPHCTKPLEEWRLFRNLYIAIKQNSYRNPDFKQPTDCGNCYIGVNAFSSMYNPKADPLYYPQLKDFVVEPNAANTGLQVRYINESDINNRCDVYIEKALLSGGTVSSANVFVAHYQEGGTKIFAIPGSNVDDKDIYFPEHIINNYNHNIDGTNPPSNCPNRNDFLLSLPTKKILNIEYKGKYPILNTVNLRVHWRTYHCGNSNNENRYATIKYAPLERGLKNVNNNSANTCKTKDEEIDFADYCTFTPSSCISDARWPSYFQKTRRFYESSGADDINTVLQGSNGGQPVGNNPNNGNDYHQNAVDLSAGWMDKLKGCTSAGDPARKEELRLRLIAVCEAGSDATHPFGSSTTKSPDIRTVPYGDASFKDAIVWYLQGTETPACNAFAIDFPLPYNSNTALNDEASNKLTACGYALLTRFKNEWIAAGGTYTPPVSTAYPSLSSYIQKKYDPNFYLTDKQIADLMTAYESGCPMKKAIRIPGILTRCVDPATPTCLKCSQLYNLQQSFKAEYPQFVETLPNYYELFAGYINEKLQMNVAPSAVYAAVEKCKGGGIFTDGCTSNQCPKVITALQRFYQLMPLSEYTKKVNCAGVSCDNLPAIFHQHITTWLNLNLGWNKDYNFYVTNYFSGCAAAYYTEPTCALSLELNPGPGTNPCSCNAAPIHCCDDYAPFTLFRSMYPNPVDPRIMAFFFELQNYKQCHPSNLPNISYQLPYYQLTAYFSNLIPNVIPYCDYEVPTFNAADRIKAPTIKYAAGNIQKEDPPEENMCATIISGNVWNDANGMTDGYVNNTSPGIPAGLYVYLVKNTGMVALVTTPNTITGAYSFPQFVCDNYKVLLSNISVATGAPAPAALLPAGFIHTGQNIGTGPGDDGLNDGQIELTYSGSQSTNINFGIKEGVVDPPEDDSTVSISGHAWGDVNGMNDGYVNNSSSSGSATNIPGNLYAYAVMPAAGNMIAAKATVNPATGTFSIPDLDMNYTYEIRISDLNANIGQIYPILNTSLPAGWMHTGQHLGISAGDDGVNDGYLTVNTGSVNITEANFGIWQTPPVNTNCSSIWSFTFAPVHATGCGSIYDDVFAAGDFVLCTTPVTPVFVSDSNACIKSMVNAALGNAEYAYNEYIKDFMRDYREAYFAKCMSITPSLVMSGKQTEYHYTLYYYDQSGNLVKTVPPKGVTYLSDNDISETGRLRDEDNGECYTNSTAPIFSNTSAHQLTVSPDVYPQHDNGPVTIESWIKFDNTVSKQFIVNQFDDAGADGKSGYYAYIENNKLFFSIFGRSSETWAKKEVQWLYPSMLPNVRAHYYTTTIQAFVRKRQYSAVCHTENLITSNTGLNNGFYHVVFQYNGDANDKHPVKIYVNGVLQSIDWDGATSGNNISNGFVDGLANVPSVPVPQIDAVKYEQLSVEVPFSTASHTDLIAGAINRTVNGISAPGFTGRMKHLRLYNAAPDAADLRRNCFDGCFMPATRDGLVLWLPLNRESGGLTAEIQSGAAVPITAAWDNPAQPKYPQHTMPTYYAYNSLNQVIHQETPDAGQSNFWYDRLGRLVVSQNAEQSSPVNSGDYDRYSYTKYDEQGRIAEVGEKKDGSPIATVDTKDPDALDQWMAGGTNRQITQTIYDEPDQAITVNPDILSDQLRHFNSRKRVVTSLYRDTDGHPDQYNFATHYVYDISGNVKRLYQENKQLPNGKQVDETKVMDYDFDLISGKVNEVYYQKNKQDQYVYRYAYDADNRIIDVQSGRDELTLRHDANYRYYLHGPLARTELGHDIVQGVDYAYTLQGWLKGINGLILNKEHGGTNFDLGNDGMLYTDHATIPSDVYGYTLGYYENDYAPVNDRGGLHPISLKQFGFNTPGNTGAGTDEAGQQLFNGNIGYTTYANRMLLSGILPVTYSYRYDQLNRLTEMRSHDVFDPLKPSSRWSWETATDEYKESVQYDPNGNILNYFRNGTTATDNGGSGDLSMDDLTYIYKNSESNRLDHVSDAASATSYTEDIKDQVRNNYEYDNIGNLIKDNQGDINNIQWTVYGKIKSITKANNDVIEYAYDPSGNRISKTVTSGGVPKTTFYYRDASGNVMGLYEQEDENAVLWKEQHLYGSSRLGMWQADIEMTGRVPNPYDETEIGSRHYELTNHLGNVMATVSDKKVQRRKIRMCRIMTNTCTEVDYPVTLVPYGYVQQGHPYWVYEADVLTANDYYPFGMQMPEREYSAGSDSYRYSINGQEKDKEINKNITTALYWEYDSRIGRRWNVDPLAHQFPWMSPYAAMDDNPINKTDPTGASTESIHIDPKGNVLLNKNDGDNTVFVHATGITTKDVEKSYTTTDHSAGGIKVGELGKNIKSGIISNILKDNKNTARSLPNEAEWVARVSPKQEWDYKNNKNTIFGVAWAFDEDNKLKTGSEIKTSFTDDVLQGHPTWASAADFGNFNAGYTGIYAKVPILHQYKWAGAGELLKGHPDVANRLNQWMQKIAPYGDNLRDYHFNTFGMQSAFIEMSKGFLKF
jgi:YD repeat-containing protein